MINCIDYSKLGSEIHIKKSHKGRFTEYCNEKVTRECIRRGKNSSDPKVRKLATFAENAGTWKHLNGGSVYFSTAENLLKPKMTFNDPRYNFEQEEQSQVHQPLEQLQSSSNWWLNLMSSLETQEPAIETSTPSVSTEITSQPSVTTTSSEPIDTNPRDKKITYDFTKIGLKYDRLNDLMKTLIRLFEEEGVPVRITSGWRYPGQAGRAGAKSHHCHGGAIDIVPANGASFDDISRAMTTNPRIRAYMQLNKLGYIDGTSKAALAKTGGTGKHFHVGPDQWALRDYASALSRYGVQTALEGGTLYFDAEKNKNKSYMNFVDPRSLNSPDTITELESISQSQTSGYDWTQSLINYLNTSDSQTSDQTNQSSSTTTSSEAPSGPWSEFRDKLYNELIKQGYQGDTAKVMVALMGLETGHGKHLVGDFNFGNITAGSSWTGKTAKVAGNHRTFRAYESLDQGILDYLRLNLTYGVTPTDSKDDVLSKWLGHNNKGLAWNGKDNTHYRDLINLVYNMYWGK